MKSRKLFMAVLATVVLAVAPVYAQEDQAPAAQDAAASQVEPEVSLELNKLEPSEKGCRAYVVVSNSGDTAYDAYKLDLVMFQTDGVIGRRFALDLAPVRPAKRSVKLFDLNGTSCDKIGSFLVNDVLECHAGSGAVDNCLARLKVSTLGKVELSK